MGLYCEATQFFRPRFKHDILGVRKEEGEGGERSKNFSCSAIVTFLGSHVPIVFSNCSHNGLVLFLWSSFVLSRF